MSLISIFEIRVIFFKYLYVYFNIFIEIDIKKQL